MITKEVIDTLYKKYSKRPKSVDCLDMPVLFDYAAEHHNISIDPETEELIIRSIDPKSPFHRVPLRHVNAIVPFEEWVAVILHSSIIFLNRKSSKVSIHIRQEEPSIIDRLRWVFR